MKRMIIKELPVLIAFCASVLTGCGLKDAVGPNVADFSASDSYQPVTPGSTWKYKVTALGFTDVKTVVMKGTTISFEGRTYNVAVATQQSDGSSFNEYFYHSGNVYTTREDASAPDDIVETQYLDDIAIIGSTFISKPNASGTNGGYPVRWLGTIIDRNGTRTVNGKTFKNVIHTKVDLQYNLGSGFTSNTVYEYYISRGVGLIELNASSGGSVYATETITNYNIK